MSATLTTVALTKLLTPICSDLYKSAKDAAKIGLSRWSTAAGIKKAAIALSRLDKVKTIWSPESEASLKQFYFPSKVQNKYSPTDDYSSIQADDLGCLPSGNIVIEGIVGQGKSMLMRHLAVSALSSNFQATLPVFLELRTITSQRRLSVAIASYFSALGISSDEDTFSYLADSGKITLLLDGFDEIPNECLADVLYELGNIQIKHPDLQIIVSSRPRNHIQTSAGFQVLELVRLSEQDYDPFISKLVPEKTKRFDIVEALKDCSDSIRGVITTPLMLTLVVLVYQTEKEIPATLSEFFDKLFGAVFSKHDRLKAGFNRQHYSGLPERRLKQLFDLFCFMVVRSGGRRSLDSAQFEAAFDDAINYDPDFDCELENFRNDIVKVACLMVEEGIDTVTFLHKSILDYHAASFVKSLQEGPAKDFYQSAFSNHRIWLHVLEFLKSIDTPKYQRHYVLKHLSKMVDALTEVLNTNNKSQLIDYLEGFLPDLIFEFKNFELKTIGPFTGGEIELYQRIGDIITQTLHSGFDDCEDRETSMKAFKASRKDMPAQPGQFMTLRQYLLNFDTTNLIIALAELENEFRGICDQASDNTSKNKVKDGLFKKMLKEAPRIGEDLYPY